MLVLLAEWRATRTVLRTYLIRFRQGAGRTAPFGPDSESLFLGTHNHYRTA